MRLPSDLEVAVEDCNGLISTGYYRGSEKIEIGDVVTIFVTQENSGDREIEISGTVSDILN